MKYSLALFLLFIGLSSALAQAKPKPRKKLTITEWIHAMRDCRDSVYLLRNADIVPDGKTDSLFLKDIRNNTSWWTQHQKEIPLTEINTEVFLIDVRFSERVRYRDCTLTSTSIWKR